MKTKNIIIALLVLAVLIGLNLLNQSRQARLKQSFAAKAGPELILPAGIDAKQIDRIRIFVEEPVDQASSDTQESEDTGPSEVILEKVDDAWVVTSHYNAPAKLDKVEELLTDLLSMKGDLRSSSPDVLGNYDLVPGKSIQVLLHDRGNDKDYQIEVGKSGPGMGNSGFVKRKDDSKVFIVNTNLRSTFGLFGQEASAPKAQPWLDLAMLKLEPSNLKGIDMETPFSELELVRQEIVKPAEESDEAGESASAEGEEGTETAAAGEPEYEWVLQSPADLAFELKEGGVSTWLGSLGSIEAADVLTPKPDEETGLDQPAFVISFTMQDGSVKTLHVGDELEGGAGERYARVDGVDLLYSVPRWRLRNVFRKTQDLFDLYQVSVLKNDVLGLTLSGPAGEVAFQRADAQSDWSLVKPDLALDANKTQLDGVLNALATWKSADLVTRDAPELFGFDNPSASIAFNTGDEQMVFTIGAPVPGADSARFARVSGVDQVLVLPDYKFSQVNVDPMDAVEMVLLGIDLENLQGFVLHDGDQPGFEVRRDGTDWVWAQGEDQGTAASARVRTVAQALTNITPVLWQPGMSLEDAGLANPARRAVVTWLDEDGNEQTDEVWFGDVYGENKIDQYIALSSVPSPMGVTATLADRVFVPLDELKAPATADESAEPEAAVESAEEPPPAPGVESSSPAPGDTEGVDAAVESVEDALDASGDAAVEAAEEAVETAEEAAAEAEAALEQAEEDIEEAAGVQPEANETTPAPEREPEEGDDASPEAQEEDAASAGNQG
jgi:hypothetical protein